MDNKELKKDTVRQKDNDLNANSSLILMDIEERGHLFKKTEKIVAAVYLVSGLFPDHDPLKHSLRAQSIELLSLINSNFRLGIVDPKNYTSQAVVAKIDTIVSLIYVAFFAGFISEMNFKVLKDELEWFSAEIKKSTSHVPINLVLPDDFLVSRTQVRSQIDGAQNTTRHIRTTTERIPAAPPRGVQSVISKGQKNADKNSRKNLIIDLIKKHKEMNIKDIASHITDCGEKTIQRELIALIDAGVIKRKGERRWSTYSLSR